MARFAMGNGEGRSDDRRAGRRVVYCLIPAELAPRIHEGLRRHYRDDSGVEVVVERRQQQRRGNADRRGHDREPPRERRLIRSVSGRRIGDRRAPLLESSALELPRRFRRFAEQIAFVERVEPSSQELEDRDTARLVTRFQAGERESTFTAIYSRYFDRVYGYLRTALRDPHEAEDAAQQVFTRLFEALPRYERRCQPFRAWLFTLVRNEGISRLRKHGRLEFEDPSELQRARDAGSGSEPVSQTLDWISDRDLMLFVERLPIAQRQVLLLRYVLDLSNTEIAGVLGRSAVDVSTLHHRAVKFLRARLSAVGREPRRGRARSEWRRRPRTVQVLRARRFALTWRA